MESKKESLEIENKEKKANIVKKPEKKSVKKNVKMAHINEKKKELVNDLIKLLKKKTIMIVSIKDLPDTQFQSLKKMLRNKAEVRVSKKSLINFAMESSKNKELEKLSKYLDCDFAVLFSDEDVFELSGFLSENKKAAKAKGGQEATEDIEVKAGPTGLLPGPDISALSGVGLIPKVENGKISVMQDKILVKQGEIITPAKASILAKLDITPFEIGLNPLVAFSDGKVYTDIKIDKKEALSELISLAGKAIAFAVSINYANKDTLPFILGKASSHENAINCLIKNNNPKKVEEKKEEVEENKSESDSK